MEASAWFELDADGFPTGALRLDRLAQARRGPLCDQSDLDAALTLLDAIGDWVEAWDEGVGHESRYVTEDALRTLQVICHRMGIQVDLTSDLDVSGGRRRHYAVWDMLRPAHEALLAYERELLVHELEATGWPVVDVEVEALRDAWRRAQSVQGFSAVGNHAVRVLEVLSDVVGDVQIPKDRTKNRIMTFLDSCAGGSANDDLKKIASHAFDLAHGVKHDRQPSRMKAGSAASAAIMIVGMVRIAFDSAHQPAQFGSHEVEERGS